MASSKRRPTGPKTGLARGQLLEIVTHALELDQGGAARVVYDAYIPELLTGKPRQVDIGVFGQVSGRVFLRIVEVQHRDRRVTVEFVDRVEGKRAALCAHRATIVTTAGFTSGALDRIRAASHQLDAFELALGREHDWPKAWPLREVSVEINGVPRAVPLEHRRYRNALTRGLVCDLLYGPVLVGAKVLLFCIAVPPNGRANQSRVFAVGHGIAFSQDQEHILKLDYTEGPR
jgi:hypothetical protein